MGEHDNMSAGSRDGAGGALVVDGPDYQEVDAGLRASVCIALRIYNAQILEGRLRRQIELARAARTVGQMRKIIASVDLLLHG